jgi:hypothetical protein
MEKVMEKVFKIIKMEEFMMDNGCKINGMEMEFSLGQMEINTLGNLKMTNAWQRHLYLE